MTSSYLPVVCTSTSLWPSGLGGWTLIKIHSAFFTALLQTCWRHVVGSNGRGFYGYSSPVLTASHSSQEWQPVFLITSVICPLTDQLSRDRRVAQGRKALYVTKQGHFSFLNVAVILFWSNNQLYWEENENKLEIINIQTRCIQNSCFIIVPLLGLILTEIDHNNPLELPKYLCLCYLRETNCYTS